MTKLLLALALFAASAHAGSWRFQGTSGAPPFSNTKSLLTDGSVTTLDLGTAISSLFARTNTFSFSVWLKPSALPASAAIFDNLDDANNYRGVFVGTAGATVYIQLIDGTNQPTRSVSSALTVGVWTYLVVTYDGSSNVATGVKIYLNGVAQTTGGTGSTVTGNTVSLKSLRIGGQQGAGDGFWNGYIDEPSIYTTVVSQAQVTANYGSGKPTDLTSSVGIAHWYRDGDLTDTTSTIFDRIGSANGTLTLGSGSYSTNVP